MINRFKTYLENKLKEELPGKYSHQEAAPYRNLDYDKKLLDSAKKSGVLILFYQKNKEIFTVLMQRTVYNGKHSGQISFPGGKAESIDLNIFDTALREAQEELGIIKKKVTTIGQISDIYIPVSNFHVVPVIGVTNNTPNFILEQREVAEIIEVKVTELIKTQLKLKKIEVSKNKLIKIPSFEHQEKIIWGATALMLNELKYLLKDWEI